MTETEVAASTPATPAVAKSPANGNKEGSSIKDQKGTSRCYTPDHRSHGYHVTARSSLPAIKKYLSANYKVDAVKLAPFIRKFLKATVAKGVLLVQTNGAGASGHFKLAAEAKKKPAAKKPSSAKAGSGTPKKEETAGQKSQVCNRTRYQEGNARQAQSRETHQTPAKTKKSAATKPKPPKAKKLPAKKPAASPKKK